MWISALNMMGKSDTRIRQTFYVLPLLIMAEMFENVGFKNPTYRITFIFKVVEKHQLHTLGTK